MCMAGRDEAPGNRVPFVAPQRESRPGGRCGTHDWSSGMNGRDPAELRPQGQPFSPAGSLPYAAAAWRGGQPASVWSTNFPRRVGLYAEYRLTGG
jgi:hypothetical protein